jgi:phosphatidyl-myo-inositol dimannoside synthase
VSSASRGRAGGGASGVGLATITRAPGADGVAHVGRLLHRALRDLSGVEPWVADLDARRPGAITLAERARFVARIAEAQLLRRVRFVLYNHPGIASAHRALPRPLRTPYGVFVHGIEVWGEPLPEARTRVLREAALRVSNSHFTARRVMELYPDVGDVVACPLALAPDAGATDDVDRALLARIADRSVLIAGRMSASERYKGHDELLSAWPVVRAAVPDAQLVVVGGGDDAERLMGRARELGFDDTAVLFGGRVSDATLDALFARSRAFAMPSRGEGFGIVYLQAMRAGKPCIGSTDDAAGDVIVDGETGFLVPQSDLRALAGALTRLLHDDELAERLGRAGRLRYEREFTYARFVDRLSAALNARRARTEAA